MFNIKDYLFDKYLLILNKSNMQSESNIHQCLLNLIKSGHCEPETLESIYSSDNNVDIFTLLIKNIFYKHDKISFNELKIKMDKFNWVNDLVEKLAYSLEYLEANELSLFYKIICRAFSLYYNDIKRDFSPYLDSLRNMNNINIFGCYICFLIYLNKKKKHLLIFEEINKNETLIKLEEEYNLSIKKQLYYTLIEYCQINKIKINTKNINRGILDEYEIKNKFDELKCYVDICPTNLSFKKFYISLYECIGQKMKDILVKNAIEIKRFIEDVFQIWLLYFKDGIFLDEYNLSLMYDDIYTTAFNYTSDTLNKNYFDFILAYFNKYNIPRDHFAFTFIKGLDKDKFNKTYEKMNINEKVDITDSNSIQYLIKKLEKKKQKKKQKLLVNNKEEQKENKTNVDKLFKNNNKINKNENKNRNEKEPQLKLKNENKTDEKSKGEIKNEIIDDKAQEENKNDIVILNKSDHMQRKIDNLKKITIDN